MRRSRRRKPKKRILRPRSKERVTMTAIVGFLVGDYGPNGLVRPPLGLDEELERTTLVDNFPPWGAILQISMYPDRDFKPSLKKRFLDGILRLYEGLLEKGLRDVRMAATLLSDALEGYELREIGHELAPDSLEDWCVLGDILEENLHRVSIRGKGIIAVARIRHTG